MPATLFPALDGVKDRSPLLQRHVLVIPRGHQTMCDVFLNAPRLENVVLEGCSSLDCHTLPLIGRLCMRDCMGDGALLNVLSLPALEEFILSRGAGLPCSIFY